MLPRLQQGPILDCQRNAIILNMKDLVVISRMVIVANASTKQLLALLSIAFLMLTGLVQIHRCGLAGKRVALQQERCLDTILIALVLMQSVNFSAVQVTQRLLLLTTQLLSHQDSLLSHYKTVQRGFSLESA